MGAHLGPRPSGNIAYISGDPFFNAVSLLLHGDGTNGAQNNTFLDSSTNNATVTRYGNTTQGSFSPFAPTTAYSTSVNGGSIQFNGSTDYLTLSNTPFSFGTNSFTVDFWYYYVAGNSTYNTIFDNGSQGVFLSFDTSTKLLFFSSVAQTNATGFAHGMTVNTWNHIAFVRDGTVATIYVNGVSIGSRTGITGSMSPAGGTTAFLGQYSGGGSYYLNGYISNFRVINGIALYTSNFTPSPGPSFPVGNTSLLLTVKPNDSFKDTSNNNLTITRVGTPTFNNVGPFNPAPLSTGTSQNVPMRQFRDGTIMISGFYDEVGAGITLFVPGLAGKFFNGTNWRATISDGNIGTLPLTTANDSSNVTGTTGLPSAAHRYGVNLWPSIAYATLGDSYGFIAIGYFTPPTTGTYTIYTSSDDGSGVWIGDLALVGATRTTVNATLNNGMGGGQGDTKRSATIALTGGVTYPIRIVMEEGIGGDNLTFSWSGPGITETTDLLTYFKTPVNPDGSLTGNY